MSSCQCKIRPADLPAYQNILINGIIHSKLSMYLNNNEKPRVHIMLFQIRFTAVTTLGLLTGGSLLLGRDTLVTFVRDRQSNSFAARQADVRLVSFADDEDVIQPETQNENISLTNRIRHIQVPPKRISWQSKEIPLQPPSQESMALNLEHSS